jgi:tRNA(Ile)-lysidine synthase
LDTALTAQEFSHIISTRFGEVLPADASFSGGVAVAVSGGPDSMVLLRLLSLYALDRGSFPVYALVVDHGLRAEAAQEAEQVKAWITDWPCVKPEILRWQGKPQSRVQEQARKARYGLMAERCHALGVGYLFLGHHMDDQAETFLFRLAKGSGLDGLSSMSALQESGYGDLMLARPFLDIPKSRLLATCAALGVPYVIDPSNASDNFARVRLRKSAEVLAAEGMTAKRLSKTAHRIARARDALEFITEEYFQKILLERNTHRIVLSFVDAANLPDEIGFRLIIRAIKTLCPEEDYLPRMEKIEDLYEALRSEGSFRKRTLGGLIFERDDKVGRLIIVKEN